MKFSLWHFAVLTLLSACGVFVPSDENVIQIYGDVPLEPANKTDELRLLLWNVHEMGDPHFKDDFIELSKDKDLILLQEAVNSEESIETLEAKVGMAWVFSTAFIRDNGVSAGVVTGTSFPVLESDFNRSPKREPFSGKPKMTLITKIDTGHRHPLLIINFHGLVFRHKGSLHEQLYAVNELLNSFEGPVVFAGDFNTYNNSRRRMLRTFMQQNNLIELPIELEDNVTKLKHTNLDFIFIRDLESGPLTRHMRTGSDHPALSVTLKF